MTPTLTNPEQKVKIDESLGGSESTGIQDSEIHHEDNQEGQDMTESDPVSFKKKQVAAQDNE